MIAIESHFPFHADLIYVIFFFSLTEEVQYTNDILAMISPENEKVSLGRVSAIN